MVCKFFLFLFGFKNLRYYILGALFGNANTGEYFNTFEFILFFSYQIAVHFASVFAIVIVSSAASRESRKTAICVHKLLNVTEDETLKIKLTQLSMQLSHRKVKFTACGMFTLDRSLIFTVSASIEIRNSYTNAIVILIFSSSYLKHVDCKKFEHISHNFGAIHIQRTCKGPHVTTHLGRYIED